MLIKISIFNDQDESKPNRKTTAILINTDYITVVKPYQDVYSRITMAIGSEIFSPLSVDDIYEKV